MTNLTVQVSDRLAKEMSEAGQEFIAEWFYDFLEEFLLERSSW